MKSKDLIEKTRLSEASNTPPGVTTPGGAPDPEDFSPEDNAEPTRARRPGGLPRPGRPTPQNDSALLRDALLLALAAKSGDSDLAMLLVSGQTPEGGQIQHILDEAGPIADQLPAAMKKELERIYLKLQGGGV